MNGIEEENYESDPNTITSESKDSNKEEEEEPQIKRRTNKLKTLKADKTNLELIFNKVGKVKQKRLSISIPHRMNSIILSRNSSKQVGVNKKSSKNIVTDIGISNIVDPSINFNMNYQLKETALKIFQAGFEENQTKIKFFCNYLYQLIPFNKIFTKLSKSKDPFDLNKLEQILYNLALKLKYEFIEKNKIVYLHGNEPDKFYIILKGEVDIIIPNEMEVMMSEYEYYYYILRLYKFQEHSLLDKVLSKNYDKYPLNKKLLEDWIKTAFNTLVHLEKESELNKIRRKKRNKKNYTPSYTNTTELINHLEKEKKLNLLMLNQNVILLLEKIRIRNEKARDAKRNKTSIRKKKENKKNKKPNNEDNLKPNVTYVKLNGQLKKIFVNDDQIEVVEKCANEISQLIDMGSEEFNFQKFLNQLNRCNPEKYINRVMPCFFDEDTNEKLDPEQFILSKSQNNKNLDTDNAVKDENDVTSKLKKLFGFKKDANDKRMELFRNRKKTIVYNYVMVNSLSSGESFGDIIYETNKQDVISPRISTIISKENCHFATLKKDLYNKILKEFNENNLYLQFLFLYSLDIFKDCNKNIFMRNMSFFIKRTIRANEILFNQDDDLGDDRSIFFIESGSFSSYCYKSINDIEILFKNLNYDGIIQPDDAHEDNLFNKENHYFCQFKDKKFILNLFNFSKKDMIGYNDALYNNKYIYTVKCQSSTAIIYEIKLKFFNLIINSEVKLFQILEKYEIIKRNLMMKFFLNAFNNKINFYKFVSFDNLEEQKQENKIVHKNYFGKNPFVDEKKYNGRNINKQSLKTGKTINKVNDNIMELMPELKKADTTINNTRLNNIKKLTQNNFFNNNTQITTNNKNNMKLAFLVSNKSMNKYLMSSRNIKQLLEISTEKINRTLKKKLSGIYSLDKKEKTKVNNNKYKSTKNINSFPIIMNTLPNREQLLTDYKSNKDIISIKNFGNQKNINNTKYNSNEINKNTEYSFASSILSENLFKTKKNKSIKYLNKGKNVKLLKTCGSMDKTEEIKLKNYLKNIPDFFKNNKNSKKIFFGMNNKTLYQNKILFTDFK